MIIALTIYLVLFALVSLVLIGAELLTPKQERDSWLETVSNVVDGHSNN